MSLYDNILNVARPYLGPAAEKFISRQIGQHLSIDAQKIASQQLDELAKWCLISGKLIMDESKAQEFSQKVKALK